jgi:hypothetical protein
MPAVLLPFRCSPEAVNGPISVGSPDGLIAPLRERNAIPEGRAAPLPSNVQNWRITSSPTIRE